MTSLPTNHQHDFFNVCLLSDTISQHIEERLNQQNKPKQQKPDPNTFIFNGVEFRAKNPRPALIPLPRIG